MESSGSDAESECFESAEESLEENSELESKKIKSKKSSYKNEGEIAEPVFRNYNIIDYSGQLGENISNLSYRKRPERVKRSLTKQPRKSISKSPSNETIFNADKIVTDVFFQDITSSLSKNINKSLNTLQLTSSNVKDLILSSLPVSSMNDNDGFSYDDKNVSLSLTETDLNTKPSSQFNYYSDISLSVGEKVVENEEKNFEGKLTSSQTAANLLITSNTCGPDEIVNIANIRTGNSKKENCNFKNNITDDIVTQEMNVLNKEVNEGQFNITYSSFDCLSKAAGSKSQQNVIAAHEKTIEDLQDSYKTSSSYRNTEISDDQKEVNNEEINKANSLNILSDKNQQNEKCVSMEEKHTKTLELLDEESNYLQKKYFESTITNKLSYENNEIYSEITNVSESLTSKNGDDYTYVSEDKNKVPSNCNLKELKMALKNIVKDEKNSLEVIKGNIEKKMLKEESTLEEKGKVNLNLNDGWDDFDFSDDEIENINTSEKDKNVRKKNKNLNDEQLRKNKAEVVKTKTLNGSMEVENPKLKELVSNSNNLGLIFEQNLSAEEVLKNSNLSNVERNNTMEEDQKKTEKPTKSFKSKSVSDVSWDWDNWDEIPDNKEKVESKPTEDFLSKKTEEDFFDVSKWSGWDTFGQKPQEKLGNWNLGSWGVDVLLNKATAVTQGISNVIEAGLGAPDPETLIRLEKKDKLKEPDKKKSEVDYQESFAENSKKNSLTNVSLFPVSGITNLVAGVTNKIVEHSKIQEIGSKVIIGGLDTLESFGKKTMEVLQEGDPGLKNKRALLLGSKKPILSQVLREAREKADKEMKKAEEKEIAKKCHFETLFDDFQGMVHLEALEMLSRQAELKLDQIKSGMNSEELEDLNGVLEEVEQLCGLEEFNNDMKSTIIDFKTALQMAVEPLKNEISIERMIQILEDVNTWLKMAIETKPSIILINQELVSALAELTAVTVHQFHKSGELLSVKECRKTVEEVDALSRLTNVLCKEINRLGEKFLLLSHKSSYMDSNSKNVNFFNEKVDVVVNNSILYIRQAFDLLIPVIQLGAAV